MPPLQKFKALEGIEVSDDQGDLACYGFDASGMKSTPALVAWPRRVEHVSAIMRTAFDLGVPVVPRGAGTGMTAGSVPPEGSLVMSMEKMARILEVDSGNQTVMVEPGLINGDLQRELVNLDLFYPPDPASMDICTLGGNVAENAGGPRALKYGVTRDYVMQLEAVLPDGHVITTGVRTHKGVVGYDLTRLLVGSEGTLGVLTKLRLKVLPMPHDVLTLLAFFGDLASAGRAVSNTLARGVIPRTMELMDRGAIEAVESFRPAGLPLSAEALLLIELDGHRAAIEREAAMVIEECAALGGDVEQAADSAARERLWAARRAISPALHHTGMRKINEDVVVPRQHLAEMLTYLRRLGLDHGVPIINFGHAGDGNIHVNIMAPRGDHEAYGRAHALVRPMFEKVLALGGTISGEHGVGLTKAEYISMEVGERELDLMRAVKDIFDPTGIMNPHKIFPEREG